MMRVLCQMLHLLSNAATDRTPTERILKQVVTRGYNINADEWARAFNPPCTNSHK